MSYTRFCTNEKVITDTSRTESLVGQGSSAKNTKSVLYSLIKVRYLALDAAVAEYLAAENWPIN